MEITLQELMKGKSTKIKGKEYFSAEQYITPFLDRLSKYTNDFKIQAILPNQISLTREGDINYDDIVYNRVYIQAILPDDIGFDNHVKVIGMVYGLDTRKPISKIFSGGLNCACTNLCTFNTNDLVCQELDPETPIDYSCIEPMIDRILTVAEWLNKLSSIEVPYNDLSINQKLGQWVRNALSCEFSNGVSKSKLATSTAIDAYKLLYEKDDSPYFVSYEQPTTMFNIYNAWTDIISHDSRDIINTFDKILLLRKILEL